MAKETLLFRKPYEGHERTFTEAGRALQDTFGYEIDKFGQKVLIKTGETDLYAKIQESLEETKIENILKSVMAGDTSVLRPDGIYEDISNMPKNLIEARQAMQNLENLWNTLDKEIKEKYDWSVEKFIGASGSETWLKDMGIIKTEDPVMKETPKAEKTEKGADEA